MKKHPREPKIKFPAVRAEIRAVIDRGTEKSSEVVAAAVLKNHTKVRGQDKAFLICCAFRAVRNEARGMLNLPRVTTLGLPGIETRFEFLQQQYAIDREGTEVHILIDECTDEELLAKADEHEKGGQGQLAHADELRRYVALRREARKSGSAARKPPDDLHAP